MNQAGFTLIEILVALAVMAIIAAVLTISASSGGTEPRMQKEMQRLRARIEYACERAELTGRDLGLHFGSHHYGFSHRREQQWEFELRTELSLYELPKGLHFESADGVLGSSAAKAPQMFCFSSGERSPLRVTLSTDAEQLAYRLSGEWNSALQIERRSSDSAAWIAWREKP